MKWTPRRPVNSPTIRGKIPSVCSRCANGHACSSSLRTATRCGCCPAEISTGSSPVRGGPRIVLATWDGQTLGRSDVAKYAARLFPRVARSFIDSVIAERAYPKEHFPSGPYPADRLTYKNPRIVEFATPANKEGLGTSNALKRSDLPIRRVAVLRDRSTPATP